MKKAAIFVEGQTELIFMQKFVVELAGSKNVTFRIEKKYAGTYLLEATQVQPSEKYQILLVNCCNDGQVLTSILERHQSLTSAGYELILGVRDLFPLTLNELTQLNAGISSKIPTTGAPTEVIIAVAEIEAWFLQENRHFSAIDQNLDRTKILSSLQYDIDNDLAEKLDNPAVFLNEIYNIAGKSYTKRRKSVQRTVDALDYAHLYLDRRHLLSSMSAFATKIEAFLLSS